MLSKWDLYILSIFSSKEKSTGNSKWESNLLRLCGKKALQTWLIMNAIFNMVTSLVKAWKPARVETSQYIKSHETLPTLQINYCIVEHVKKTTCAPMREKPHILGKLPSPLTCVVTVTDKLCIWPHLAEHKCTFKVGMDIHIWTFLIQSWRSVVLQRISKPEINRPKLVKLFLSTKYIQSNYDVYATEQNTGLREALHCHM